MRGVISRFTFRPGINRNPVWSPDGSSLVFALQGSGGYSGDIYRKPAGGNGREELLIHAGINGFPTDWSPDGKWIVYQQSAQKTAIDLWLMPVNGARTPVPYLQTPFDETEARFSPDGRWMAYVSNESGLSQIYVQSVPPSGTKYQISASGGVAPQWRRDGKELFYVSADQKLMAAPIKLGATVEVGAPEALFHHPSNVATTRPTMRRCRTASVFWLTLLPAGRQPRGRSRSPSLPIGAVLSRGAEETRAAAFLLISD